MRHELASAMAGAPSALGAADLLCTACVRLLDVDGAAISLIHQDTSRGTFGSSGELSRQLDELQFTFGEGPCLDAAGIGRVVRAPDLSDTRDVRWPMFAQAALTRGAGAVFAFPIALSSVTVGALDLFRHRPGELSPGDLVGAGQAASLAALPLLDLMSADVDWLAAGQGEQGFEQLASLDRVEVYQATGMLMGAWDVTPTDALVQLRAHAFALGTTAHELAAAVVERSVLLDADGWVTDETGERA